MLVTDHHRPGEALPDCTIVHPGSARLPGSELCAAGVALKLSEALRAAAGQDPATPTPTSTSPGWPRCATWCR